jgi:hypothetical protein
MRLLIWTVLLLGALCAACNGGGDEMGGSGGASPTGGAGPAGPMGPSGPQGPAASTPTDMTAFALATIDDPEFGEPRELNSIEWVISDEPSAFDGEF